MEDAPRELLTDLFACDEEADGLAARLLGAPESDLLMALEQASADALDRLRSAGQNDAPQEDDGQGDRAARQLERVVDLLRDVENPAAIEILFRVLQSEDEGVRTSAGEAMLERAYDRYGEFARNVEGWLGAAVTGPAMGELPWILVEVGEPSAESLIRGFLDHPEAEVVASALEALMELSGKGQPLDAKTIGALGKLATDSRPVSLDDDDSTVTLGELVQELRDPSQDN